MSENIFVIISKRNITVFFFSDNQRNSITNYLINRSPLTYVFLVFFSVENAYMNGRLDTVFINDQIKILSNLSNSLMENRILDYKEKDKENVSKWASIYQVIRDTIPLIIGEEEYSYIPLVSSVLYQPCCLL